jgi:hypothetical protein
LAHEEGVVKMNLCVMCGRSIPDEASYQVCKVCQITADMIFQSFQCPECDHQLEIYAKNITHMEPEMHIDLLYHCPYCHQDWLSQYVRTETAEWQTVLRRHFWG